MTDSSYFATGQANVYSFVLGATGATGPSITTFAVTGEVIAAGATGEVYLYIKNPNTQYFTPPMIVSPFSGPISEDYYGYLQILSASSIPDVSYKITVLNISDRQVIITLGSQLSIVGQLISNNTMTATATSTGTTDEDAQSVVLNEIADYVTNLADTYMEGSQITTVNVLYSMLKKVV